MCKVELSPGPSSGLPGIVGKRKVRMTDTKGRSYDDAVDSFEPYDRIQEPNEGAREGMAMIAGWATPMKPAFLFVNNRLEGNAPGTIEAVVGLL